MKQRADRWPSAWAVLLHGPEGDHPVEIRNVSETGFRFACAQDLPVGSAVTFSVLGRTVTGQVVREQPPGGAIQFDRVLTAVELANLRQVRSLHSLPR